MRADDVEAQLVPQPVYISEVMRPGVRPADAVTHLLVDVSKPQQQVHDATLDLTQQDVRGGDLPQEGQVVLQVLACREWANSIGSSRRQGKVQRASWTSRCASGMSWSLSIR